MQLAWSRIWTRVAVSISNDDNYYTTGISIYGISTFVRLFNAEVREGFCKQLYGFYKFIVICKQS